MVWSSAGVAAPAHVRRFAGRVLRAGLLDPRAYREVALDPAATGDALAVVGLVAAAHALGAIVRASALGWSPATGLAFGLAGEIAFWAAGGAAIALVGRAALGGPAGLPQVLRAFGLAAAPGVLILAAAAASVLRPGAERAVLPVLALWRLAAGYVAVREALGLGAGRSALALAAGVAAGAAAVAGVGAALDAALPD